MPSPRCGCGREGRDGCVQMVVMSVYRGGCTVHLETEEERRLARSSVKSWGELRLSRDLEESGLGSQEWGARTRESGVGSQHCITMVTRLTWPWIRQW